MMYKTFLMSKTTLKSDRQAGPNINAGWKTSDGVNQSVYIVSHYLPIKEVYLPREGNNIFHFSTQTFFKKNKEPVKNLRKNVSVSRQSNLNSKIKHAPELEKCTQLVR